MVEIGDFAFTECGVFTGGLRLPKNLKKIGYSAFSDNNTGVYHGAFKGELVIPEGVIEIGDRAFMNTGFSGELVIPSSVKKIGDQTFRYCIKLAGLTLQEGLVSIGNSAFFAANALSGDLVIPEGVTKIGDQAFTYCTKLENVSLPNSVETIGNSAFHTEDDRGYMIPCNILMCCKENTYAYDWATHNGFEINTGKLETKYSIVYNLDGGTNNETNPVFYKSNSEKIVLQNPTKQGYKFAGWYSDSNYKTKVTEITTGSTGNKTLYAKWTPNQYMITFDGNGASSGKMNSIAAKYGTEYTLTTSAYKKTGYTFTGWNTKKDGNGTSYSDKEVIQNLASKDSETITLYAQWKKTTYKITYNLNSGKNSSSNPSAYTVTTSTIKLKNPTRTGYTFGGWYTSSKYKTKITEIKKGSTGNKTVYAKWTPNKYTITFKGNGSTSGKMSSMTSRKYGTSYKLTSNTFKKKGYKFVGWNTKANGKGKSYKNKASVKNLTSKNGGKVTLYAQWKKK